MNRPAGAGARALLDAQLRRARVDPQRLAGYERELPGQLDAGRAVAQGFADAAVGLASLARLFDLDFIPLREERCSLLVPSAFARSADVRGLIDALRSAAYRRDLEALGLLRHHPNRRDDRMNRRTFVTAAATAGAALLPHRLLAQALTTLDVAYAGSMGSMMEGPVKAAVARQLQIAFQGRAQGSDALANLIVGGSISPDVFVAVTPSPMDRVVKGGKAEIAYPVARTEMVIAYSPKSTFAPRFADAGKRGAMPWWQILEQPGLRFGRPDPLTDPQGRNIIFTMQLAAMYYRQPDLVQRVLGDAVNPSQIFSEPTVEARLQSGELDAAAAYRIQPGPFSLPYLRLPREINLADDALRAHYAQAALTLDERAYHPEPLVYYAAVLGAAPHKDQAAAFVRWLQGSSGQAILRRYGYDPASGASPLHA